MKGLASVINTLKISIYYPLNFPLWQFLFKIDIIFPMEENKNHFKIHIDEHKPHAPHKEVSHHTPVAHKAQKAKHKGKELLKDWTRQIVASFVFLVVGFFLLNFSAYWQIIELKWDQLLGNNENTPLTDLVEDKQIVYTKEKLQTSSDPNIQKRQIPELNLEVSPPDTRIIVPRINQNIPIVRVSSENLIKRDWAALEKEMQEALQGGVVHYPGTSLPGQSGNTVITGHSSYFPWDAGRFKDVFALLHDVVVGDKIVVYRDQDKYTYGVYEIKVVLPEDIAVLKQTPEDKLTLITCTPVGTNLKRLIVTAKPILKNDRPLEEIQKKVRGA